MKPVTFNPPNPISCSDEDFARLLASVLGQQVTLEDGEFDIEGTRLSRQRLNELLPELIRQSREAWNNLLQGLFLDQ